MLRSMLVLPLLAATALAAQVPVPPAPRAEPLARAMPEVPVAPVAPLVEMDLNDRLLSLDTLNLDLDLNLANLDRVGAESNLRLAELSDRLSDLGALSRGPVSWAPQDPADSLWRMAKETLNRGDYRRAAELFKSLPAKFPNSAYISDAQYWQAFSLYRIGGTPELQEALKVLEDRKPDARADSAAAQRGARNARNVTTARADSAAAQRAATATARAVAAADRSARSGNGIGSGTSSGVGVGVSTNVTTDYSMQSRIYFDQAMSYGGQSGEADAAGLAARIASVLSSRGMANDPAVKRALAAGGNSCDPEDQSVKAEALNALMQSDPETGRQMAAKILSRQDNCSAPLRRNAVMLIGNKGDDAAAVALINAAKSDSSVSVRMAAMDWLVRMKTDAALNAVMEMARSDADQQIQRAAVNALTRSDDARAKAELRKLVEDNTAKEALRMTALDAFDRDRSTTADAAWLRDLYGKVSSQQIKDRIVSAIAQIGGDANNQWLTALLRNSDEPLELRSAALRRVGRTMDIPALGKLYDASAERPIREAVIQLLAERKEPEAADKLIDIAKNGTDPQMRREAINVLSRSKDPRVTKLLLDLIK